MLLRLLRYPQHSPVGSRPQRLADTSATSQATSTPKGSHIRNYEMGSRFLVHYPLLYLVCLTSGSSTSGCRPVLLFELPHCSACFSLVLYIQYGGYHHIALRNASERHRCTRTPYSHHRLRLGKSRRKVREGDKKSIRPRETRPCQWVTE